jgi:hypothetical protein
MSLATLMLEQLAISRRIIEDGQEVVPACRITTPDGNYLIMTRFDPAKPEQRENTVVLISRFMAWKMATSFVLTAETWLGADGLDALLIIGVSLHERLAVLQRIKSGDGVSFSEPMWLARHHSTTGTSRCYREGKRKSLRRKSPRSSVSSGRTQYLAVLERIEPRSY